MLFNNIQNILNISRYNKSDENMAMHCSRTAILSVLIAENINENTKARNHLIENVTPENDLLNIDVILQENILRGLIKPFKGDLSVQMQKLLIKKGIDNNAIMRETVFKAQQAFPSLAIIMENIYINRKYKEESFVVEVASIIDDLVQIHGGFQFFYRYSSEKRIELILEQLKLSRIELPEFHLDIIDEIVTIGLQEPDIAFYLKYSELKHIKRWNGIQVINKNENDLEHSYKVAALMLLFVKPEELDKDLTIGELILKSLLHDFSEVDIGDVPTPIKYSSDNTKNMIHGIEDEYNLEYLQEIKLSSYFLRKCLLENKKNDFSLVDFFDKVDANLFSINQHNLGNKYFQILIKKTYESLLEFENIVAENTFNKILKEIEKFQL